MRAILWTMTRPWCAARRSNGSKKASRPRTGRGCRAIGSGRTKCDCHWASWPTTWASSGADWSCRLDQTLVAHESPAAAGEDRGPAREACPVLLAPAGRRSSDPAAVRRHAAEDLGAAGAGRLTRGTCTQPAWRRRGTRVEQCLRNILKAGAPVGRTSARGEVTPSGAGRLGDGQNFLRSAALGCITVPSGPGKTEIPVKGAIEPGKSKIPVQRFDNVPRLFFPFLWVFWKLFYAVLTTAHWILNRTCRIDIEGHTEGRHILCGWHESIIPYSVAYRRLPLRYLVIQNNAWFMPPIIWLARSRGARSSIDISYSSFEKSTISKVTSQLAAGESLLAFPDGPSGPAHVLDRSLLVVAERSGAPIIPLRVETSMALVISWAWDKKRIPLPFSRVRVRCGNPIVAVPGKRQETERKLLAALGP